MRSATAAEKQEGASGKKLSAVKAMFDAEEKAAAHPTRKKNIKALWDTLESLRSEGCEDWSLANVGRRSEKRKGLKTQSLRNSQGERFRELISAYAQAVRPAPSKGASSNIDEILSSVGDVGSRSLLRGVIEEGKRYKHENDMLREAIKRLSIGKAPGNDLEMDRKSAGAVEVIQAPPMKKSHAGVLKRALDEKRLAERGLRIEKNGAIVDENGFEIFPPGFLEAVRAASETQ